MGNQLIESVKRELYQYVRVQPGPIIRTLTYASILLTLTTSLLFIYVLSTPMVEFDGLTLRGYVSPLHYNLYLDNKSASYPHIDSVVTISRLTLIYGLAIVALTLYALLGYKRWKTRSTLVLFAFSSISAYMFLGVVYSVLRVLAYDIVPGLPFTVYAVVKGGRLIPDPPLMSPTWTYYLPRYPLIFVILSIALFLVGSGLLVALALTPSPPALPVKRLPKKAVVVRSFTQRNSS